MADIERERLELTRMGRLGRAEDEVARDRRYAEERAREARTCRYCFHDQHQIEWVDNGGLTVLYCRTEHCACGVHPCGTCGSRVRAAHDSFGMERCAECGAEWEAGAIA